MNEGFLTGGMTNTDTIPRYYGFGTSVSVKCLIRRGLRSVVVRCWVEGVFKCRTEAFLTEG